MTKSLHSQPTLLAISIAIALTQLSLNARAQSSSTPPASAAATPEPAVQISDASKVLQPEAVLRPVVVTGKMSPDTVGVGAFRDTAPLDVPLTNNVINREVLDSQGARTLYEALRNTAGISRTQLNGTTYDNIAIRGILVENRGNYRLNGSLPIVNLIDVPLENKEQIEVLKGASSLYYGLVPPSGIINYTTKRAGSKPVASVQTTISQNGTFGAHLDMGRRFGSQGEYGARVNLAAATERGPVDLIRGQRQLVSLAADARLSNAAIKLDVEQYAREISETPAIVMPAAIGGVITLPKIPSNQQNIGAEWLKYDAKARNVLLRADWFATDSLTAMLEYGSARVERDRRYSQFQGYNSITGQGTLRIFFQNDQAYNNENIRTEVTSQLRGSNWKNETTVGLARNKRVQDITNAPTVDVPQNLYAPQSISFIPRTQPNASNPSNIRDDGIYFLNRLSLGDRWQLLTGLRRTDYSSQSLTTRYWAKKVNPSVSAIFKPVPLVSVYASYLEGLEETGQAASNRANAGELLPPAITKQMELGAKAQLASGLLVQAATFDIKRASTTVDAANRFVLGGQSTYRGFEFSATGEINQQWRVVASLLAMDAKIKRATNPLENGKTPDNTPEQTGSVFVEHQFLNIAGLSASAAAYYTGKRPLNNLNQGELPASTTFSAGVRYRTQLGGLQTNWQLNVDNLTNKTYWSNAGSGLLGVGAPRTIKLSAKVNF
jgi:iron complex outermembrane recepter protein